MTEIDGVAGLAGSVRNESLIQWYGQSKVERAAFS